MTRKGWENRPAAWDPTEGPTAESFSPNHNQGLETKPSPTLNMFLIEKLDVKFLSLIFPAKNEPSDGGNFSSPSFALDESTHFFQSPCLLGDV
jgi:hypothetical protein